MNVLGRLVAVFLIIYSMTMKGAQQATTQEEDISAEIHKLMQKARDGVSGDELYKIVDKGEIKYVNDEYLIRKFAEINAQRVHDLLVQYATDENANVRILALEGLRYPRQEGAISIALKALNDKDYRVADAAAGVFKAFDAQTLRKVGGQELIIALQDLVKKGSCTAVRLLGNLGDESSISIFKEMIKRGKDAIKEWKDEIDKWKRDETNFELGYPYHEESLMWDCEAALAKLGDKEGIQALIDGLSTAFDPQKLEGNEKETDELMVESELQKLEDKIERFLYVGKKSLALHLAKLLRVKIKLGEKGPCNPFDPSRICDIAADVIGELCKPELSFKLPPEYRTKNYSDQELQELEDWIEAHRAELEKD